LQTERARVASHLFLSAQVGERQLVWELGDTPQRIGRSSRNAIPISDPTVSKEHAEIARQGTSWTIHDLGSRNGTRVNGVNAREPLPIRAGDLIEIGHVAMRVSAEPAGPALPLNEATVMGSSLRVNIADVLASPSRTKAGTEKVLKLLAEAGRLLVLPRPLRETCDQVLEFVERAVPASRYVLLLRPSPDAEPIQFAARTGGGRSAQPLALSHTIMKQVMDERVSVLTQDVGSDSRFRAQMSLVAASVHSAMAVPLYDNENVLGLLYVDSQVGTIEFDQEQLELLTLLANMAAVKLTNARLLEAESARARVAHELTTATRIQRGLLPETPPALPGYQLDGYLETCYEVGGDLYDFRVRLDGKLVFLVGDVSGKGMGAALLMSSFLSSARVLYETSSDMSEFARRLNDVTFRSSDSSRFVTAFIGCLDPATGIVEYVNGGHNAPLLISDGKIREIEATGIPFGVLESAPYAASRFELPPGALLTVFSDGIPEAQNGDAFFDDARLQELVATHAADPELTAIRAAVLDAVIRFVGESPRSDDMTLLLLRRDVTPA
jgi:serine phosphatase RsbU (regulator of sigma subunit)